MLLFGVGLMALFGLTAWTFRQVRRDYRQREQLAPATVGAVWLLYLLHFAVELYAAWQRYLPFDTGGSLAIGVGLLLIISGTAIYAIGIFHLKSIERMSGRDTSRLVTTGIYRWSRNPQNVGWALVLVGIGLISRSGMAIILALLFCAMFRYYVPMEERYLESIYGNEYQAYKMKSHRYFGLPESL